MPTPNERNFTRILLNGSLITINLTKYILMSDKPVIDPNDCKGKVLNVWGKHYNF